MIHYVKHSATLDSSFGINAHRSELLSHVVTRYTLYYTREVAAELSPTFPSGREFRRLVHAGGLIAAATPPRGAVQEFGSGERSAMNLALQRPDLLLLLGDYRPFQEAVRRGLAVLCSPVLAVTLFHEGRLDARGVLQGLARLAALQTVSPHLLAAALAQVGRSLGQPGGN